MEVAALLEQRVRSGPAAGQAEPRALPEPQAPRGQQGRQVQGPPARAVRRGPPAQQVRQERREQQARAASRALLVLRERPGPPVRQERRARELQGLQALQERRARPGRQEPRVLTELPARPV